MIIIANKGIKEINFNKLIYKNVFLNQPHNEFLEMLQHWVSEGEFYIILYRQFCLVPIH